MCQWHLFGVSLRYHQSYPSHNELCHADKADSCMGGVAYPETDETHCANKHFFNNSQCIWWMTWGTWTHGEFGGGMWGVSRNWEENWHSSAHKRWGCISINGSLTATSYQALTTNVPSECRREQKKKGSCTGKRFLTKARQYRCYIVTYNVTAACKLYRQIEQAETLSLTTCFSPWKTANIRSSAPMSVLAVTSSPRQGYHFSDQH